MITKEKAQHAAMLLEQVAHGELDASAALLQWPDDQDRNLLIDASWHDLKHFAIDADIQAEDPDYGMAQIKRLLKRASEIRAEFHLT